MFVLSSFVFTDSQICHVNFLVLSEPEPSFDSYQPKTKGSLSKQRFTDVITSVFGFVPLSSYHLLMSPDRLEHKYINFIGAAFPPFPFVLLCYRCYVMFANWAI